jgi:hypothetical protein
VSNTGHRKSRLGAGDYWPGEAENLLSSISEEARQAGKKGKKAGGSGKGAVRPGKKGKRYGATGTTDEQLMGKLGETVQGMKEDFIVVHLQEPCSFCRCYISDEDRSPPLAPPPPPSAPGCFSSLWNSIFGHNRRLPYLQPFFPLLIPPIHIHT